MIGNHLWQLFKWIVNIQERLTELEARESMDFQTIRGLTAEIQELKKGKCT